jgi:thiamine biosynthesis protein ThiS
MDNINIILNGENKTVSGGSSVRDLIESVKLKSKMFVVEKNQNIIQKEEYRTNILQDGDIIEIVGFFGGG